jgi:plastocyanin
MNMRNSILSLLLAVGLFSGAAVAGGTVEGRVQETGSTKPVIVYIEEVAGAVPVKKGTKQRITQKDEIFNPGVIVVQMGTTVEFPNDDKVYHNVFSMTPGSEFDLGLYASGSSKSVMFPKPGEIDIYCNIHPKMAAKIKVLQNEHYVMAAKGGAFKLANVPAGKYTLVAWSPEHNPVKREIEVKDGAVQKADFKMVRRSGLKNTYESQFQADTSKP